MRKIKAEICSLDVIDATKMSPKEVGKLVNEIIKKPDLSKEQIENMIKK